MEQLVKYSMLSAMLSQLFMRELIDEREYVLIKNNIMQDYDGE